MVWITNVCLEASERLYAALCCKKDADIGQEQFLFSSLEEFKWYELPEHSIEGPWKGHIWIVLHVVSIEKNCFYDFASNIDFLVIRR